MNRDAFCICTLATAAQSVRDATGSALCGLEINPRALLTQIEQALACARYPHDAHQVLLLREATEAADVLNVGLLLLDVCEALSLDEHQTQQALSLADWSDAQCLLTHEIKPREVVVMSP